MPSSVEVEEPSPEVEAARSKVEEAEKVLSAAQKELVAAEKRDAKRKVKSRRAGNSLQRIGGSTRHFPSGGTIVAGLRRLFLPSTLVSQSYMWQPFAFLSTPLRCRRFLPLPCPTCFLPQLSPAAVATLCYPKRAGATSLCRQVQGTVRRCDGQARRL